MKRFTKIVAGALMLAGTVTAAAAPASAGVAVGFGFGGPAYYRAPACNPYYGPYYCRPIHFGYGYRPGVRFGWHEGWRGGWHGGWRR